MASPNHLKLSDCIKSVHKNLRKASKEMGSDQAWKKHCNDEENLKKYAKAMHELACRYWEQNMNDNTVSRVLWTVNTSLQYFRKDIDKFRDKEKRTLLKFNTDPVPTQSDVYNSDFNTLKLLDVGSCYNPFGIFDEFLITAIDIAPAIDEVQKCDFLSVEVGDTLRSTDNEIYELPGSYFNIVVFSLLLEYLPTPKQRLLCCQKAYNLLTKEGLLVIITPDSNHVGSNAKFMKSWRYVLACVGFVRIRYEKLPHVHCMAFRKAVDASFPHMWAAHQDTEKLFKEIYIPQDFNKSDDEGSDTEVSIEIVTDKQILFKELPECDILQ